VIIRFFDENPPLPTDRYRARLAVCTEPKRHWTDVRCRMCGTRLACGSPEDDVIDLAFRNASARPCCEAWKV
jgi:hypothetical protein